MVGLYYVYSNVFIAIFMRGGSSMYVEPNMEVVYFEATDILTTSEDWSTPIA